MNSVRVRLKARAAEQEAQRHKEERIATFLHMKHMRDNLGLGKGGRNVAWPDFCRLIARARAWSDVAHFFAVQIAHSADVTNRFHVTMAMTFAQVEKMYPELVGALSEQNDVPVVQTWITKHDDPILTGSGDATEFKRTCFVPGAVGNLCVHSPIV